MIVSYSDRFNLFCSARSVVDSFTNVTPFCAISGKVWVVEVAFGVYML